MFTGIIETRGSVVAGEARAFGRRLTIDVGDWRGRSGQLAPGDSIAISGVCLTIAAIEGSHLHFDVVGETLGATTLGDMQTGDAVNIESSLIAATPVGGHFVQGHVDGVGQITEVRGADEASEYVIRVHPPAELLDYLTPKGSVAIEGVSLTIARLSGEGFEVALIPTTLAETTLGALSAGDRVNLETDMVTRAVVHWLRRQSADAGAGQGVNWGALRDAGFVD